MDVTLDELLAHFGYTPERKEWIKSIYGDGVGARTESRAMQGDETEGLTFYNTSRSDLCRLVLGWKLESRDAYCWNDTLHGTWGYLPYTPESKLLLDTANERRRSTALAAGIAEEDFLGIEYGYATENTYAKKFSLAGVKEDESKGTFFDEASQVGGDVKNGIQIDGNGDIVKGLASAVNYTGVYGGSGFVTDDETNINESWYAEINGNKFAGLVNKEELDNWDDNTYNTAIKNAISDSFGDATQPLLVYNNEELAYGFIGKSQKIAANTYATVSVRVLVSAGAQANVYLIDADDKTHKSTLNWSSGVTYWYDEDGNVCTSDPSS
jgi:hypothetical protein